MEPQQTNVSDRQPGKDSEFVAPRTPAEEQLAAIWRELLNVERVGIHDDFFDLGGHSLLLPQLIWRIYEFFHVELPLRAIAEALTVDKMTQVILKQQVEQEDQTKLNELLEQLIQLSEQDVKDLLEKGG